MDDNFSRAWPAGGRIEYIRVLKAPVMSITWVARSSRRVPKDRAASTDEVRAAIESLSDADYLRLEKTAMWRIRGLGRRSGGRTHDDLLHEAVRAALDGTRSWDRSKVDFVGFLIGAIRSISDNWNKRYKECEPVLESELARDGADGPAPGVFERIASAELTPEEELLVAESGEAIKRLFEGDALATLIICEIEEGAKLQDIRERYGVKENDLNAAVKRIRRKIARLYEEAGDG